MLGDYPLTQPPKRSESNPGLRGGWYKLSSTEFGVHGSVGIGFISLAFSPAPVEEQPVASTTATTRVTAGNAARLMWFNTVPGPRLLSDLELFGGYVVLTIC